MRAIILGSEIAAIQYTLSKGIFKSAKQTAEGRMKISSSVAFAFLCCLSENKLKEKAFVS